MTVYQSLRSSAYQCCSHVFLPSLATRPKYWLSRWSWSRRKTVILKFFRLFWKKKGRKEIINDIIVVIESSMRVCSLIRKRFIDWKWFLERFNIIFFLSFFYFVRFYLYQLFFSMLLFYSPPVVIRNGSSYPGQSSLNRNNFFFPIRIDLPPSFV